MKFLRITLLGAALLWGFSPEAGAQLLEVKQTVYGMDCAPCAHALENRTQKMDGVQAVSVSLNEGLLTATLNSNNRLTLGQLRTAVKESGFSPRGVTIKLAGTLQEENGKFLLVIPAGERYFLQPKDEKTEAALRNREPGATITLNGLIEEQPDTETESWTLVVEFSSK